MRRNKFGYGLLLWIATIAMGASVADAQVFFFEFDGDSGFAIGQGIGASQTVRADAFNRVTITTVDLFAPEFADDGTGNFVPTGNTLSASNGDGVTTQTGSGFFGIDNPSISDDDFFAESQHLNAGEGWVVEFDTPVAFDSLNLSSFDDSVLTVTIEGMGSTLFVGGANDGQYYQPLGVVGFIPAGADITFAYSSPNASSHMGISSFTVFPGVVGDGVGDVNGDTYINFADIPAFIQILLSGEYSFQADMNFDGEVNFDDIPVFIAILSGPYAG